MGAHRTFIEALEPRIAPATTTLHIVDPHTATYNDLDGDLVTVKVSKGTRASWQTTASSATPTIPKWLARE